VSPRAWMVYQIEEVADESAISRLDMTEFDPTRTALAPPGSDIGVEQPANDAAAGIEFVDRRANSMTLKVDTPASGLLVLSEIYYPGWHATVDEAPTTIVPTDYILRGIPLAPGEHQVTLTFRPITFQIGAAISALTLILTLVIFLVTWRKSRSTT